VTTIMKTAPLTLLLNYYYYYYLCLPSVYQNTQEQQPFTALSPGPPGGAGARRERLDFMVQRKINTGRHTDHQAGRHSIRTNQCPPPPSPYFLQAGCPFCRPTNSVKALNVYQKGHNINTFYCHHGTGSPV